MMLLAAAGGCISPGRHVAGVVPILYNTTFTGTPTSANLGKAGDTVEVFGMLYNARTYVEDPQRQMLVCSDPGVPFRRTWLGLVEPIRELPACDAEFPDLWKRFVAPYRIRGQLVVHEADGSEVVRVIAAQSDPLVIPDAVPGACVQTAKACWHEISGRFANIPWKWSQRYVKLGEFVKMIEPRLLAVSHDGTELLYQCAEGNYLMPVPAESIARVYCLYDLAAQRVIRIYVESRTRALD
jgi:hypothetical protein